MDMELMHIEGYSDNKTAILRHSSILLKLLSDLQIETSYSSNTLELTQFIHQELSDYSSQLSKEDVDRDYIHRASYLISSAFDDVYTSKQLYEDSTQRGFLLHTHNEPGALSRFYDITDEISRGLDDTGLDLAILAISLMEIGYIGKYQGHPDCFAIIRVHKEALTTAVEEYLLVPRKTQTQLQPRRIVLKPPIPVWSIMSICLLIGIGLYHGVETLIHSKFKNIESTVSQLEKKIEGHK